EPALEGSRFDPLDINARAVVADADLDLVAIDPRDREIDRRAGWLAGAAALFGYLDAVIDAVTQQMNEGVLQFLQDALVDRNFLATDHEIGFLALIAAQVQ